MVALALRVPLSPSMHRLKSGHAFAAAGSACERCQDKFLLGESEVKSYYDAAPNSATQIRVSQQASRQAEEEAVESGRVCCTHPSYSIDADAVMTGGLHFGHVAGNGKHRITVVPFRVSLLIVTVPLCRSMMDLTMASLRPKPLV